MTDLQRAKQKLNDLIRSLNSGDKTIMPADLDAAKSEVVRLEREQPAHAPGVARMSAAYGENQTAARNEAPGANASDVLAEMEEKGIKISPSQRMTAGYAEISKNKTENQ